MNIELSKKFADQWKMYVRKKKEVRSILIQQYRHCYIKILYSYRELKRKRFQQYIINNASNLIYKALKINLWKVQHLKHIIDIHKVKRLYFFKSQENLFRQITNLNSQSSQIKTIRLPFQTKCNHNHKVPLLFRKIKQAVIVYNFHEMKKSYGEVTTNKDQIRYELLYYFTKLVTVKLSQKPFKLTTSENSRYQYVLKKIDKFQQEEYLLLNYVELKNLNSLKQIYIHNRKNRNNQLQIFFDFQITQIAAVCKIQKFFRSFRDRILLKKGMKLDAIMKKINQSRAIFVIQRWFKRLRWQHRINFFKEISFYVSQIPTQHLYLDLQIYQKIEEIINNLQFSIKFLEQYNMIVSDNEICRLQFSILSQDVQQSSSYTQSLKCFQDYQIKVIPQWLLDQIQIVPEKIEKVIDYAIVKQEDIITKWCCRNRSHQSKHKQSLKQLKFYQMSDIYSLLHMGAQISFESIYDRDYIRFSYSSTAEARYRVVALALQTYKFKCNGTSILLLSDHLWESPISKQEIFLQKYQQKIQRVHKIEFQKQQCSYLSKNNQFAVILCQKESDYEKFQLTVNDIQLQFFNETSKITKDLFWMIQTKKKNNRIQLKLPIRKTSVPPLEYSNSKELTYDDQKINSIQVSPHSIIEGSSKSTQVPVKFSILSIENNKLQYQEPKFKRRTEQSFIEFATTNRFRTQNTSLKNSKVKEQDQEIQENSYIYKKNKETYRLDNVSENSEYNVMKSNLQNEILNENKEKIISIKKKKQNEKIFLSEFVNFTSLLQRQERKILSKQLKSQRVKSNERGQKYTRNPKETIMYSQSVSKREDYSEMSVIFPKIEQKSAQKQQTSKLSNYHRYVVFPEELYAISSNKDTIKF